MTDERDSLIDRAARRLAVADVRAPRAAWAGVDWRFAAALAGVIALGPLATIVGAGVLERSVRAEAVRLETAASPRMKVEARERAAREMLRTAARDATVAVWLDRVAAALPSDVRVVGMAKLADGGMALEVSTPDPDLLRGRLRRNPALAGLRETGQRRSGAMIVVTLRQLP
ncbi:hypothetical protein [Sphingomonas sp. LT1P40]|uniref:hypothetical protein n=1 Tax=Alteristakelama amylovorans TaxID=3096166 RepID=UPI002FC98DCA